MVVWPAPAELPIRGDASIPTTVFMHRISAQTTSRLGVSSFPGEGNVGQVRTDGRWVVWSDFEYFRPTSGEWRILAHDTTTGETREAARNATPGVVLGRLGVTWPTIELQGGRLVWVESYATDDGARANRLHVMDLNSREARILMDSREDGLLHPSIFGDRVAFVRVKDVLTKRTNTPTIAVVDLRTGVEHQPAPQHPGYQPSIWKDHLVWKSFPLHEMGDVFLYSFADQTVRQIATQEADAPTVGERGVTWEPVQRPSRTITLYDIPTGVRVDVDTGLVSLPRLNGSVLAWNHVVSPFPDQPGDPPYRGEIRVREYR